MSEVLLRVRLQRWETSPLKNWKKQCGLVVMNVQRSKAKGSWALEELKADGVGMWQASGRIAVGRKEKWAYEPRGRFISFSNLIESH